MVQADVIGVHPRHERPVRLAEADVEQLRQALFRAVQHAQPGIVDAVQVRSAAVGRCVIEHDDFKIITVLPEQALQGLG